jgi:hypothetical protein
MACTAQPLRCLRCQNRFYEINLDTFLYFCNYRNMNRVDADLVTRFADRLSALGSGPRLQAVRLLLSAHPTGMNVGEIQEELGIPASTLSHPRENSSTSVW